jgi:aminoglycoside phosphotransferase (APT) family kinase protein
VFGVSRADAPLRDLLSAAMPGYRVATIGALGEGMENTAYLVNDELVLRLSKADDPVATVAREAGLLSILAEFSTLRIPVPVFAVEAAMAYRKLPGTPVFALPPSWLDRHGTAVAAQLGEFLVALQRIPLDRVANWARVDADPPEQWLTEARGSYRAAAERIPRRHRPAIEGFLAANPPAPELRQVFSHNDLGIEHVLVDPVSAAVTGVIDWTDAAIGDPAYDIGLILRDLGPAAVDVVLASWPADQRPALRERAVFYARCSALEDLEYGLEPLRARYADKAIASLQWLFAPGGAMRPG